MRSLTSLIPVLLTALWACGGSTPPPAAHERAPAFSAPDQSGNVVSSSSLSGQPLVLYFYPRDATPGCTVEACAFRDAWDRIQATGATVVGVSTDSVEAHRAFADEHELPFSLLADTDGAIAAAFGVPVQAGYARRMTFLVDSSGVIRRVFEDVDPGVHADEVIAALSELR